MVTGIGLDLTEAVEAGTDWRRLQKELKGARYLVYTGRIDESKGCRQMIDYFLRYWVENLKPDLKLLLIGRPAMEIPREDGLVRAGFVSNAAKQLALQNYEFAIAPSPYESLCIAALEAWGCGKPVVANSRCEVLVGHCVRSNGGLWYLTYEEFAECVDRLLHDRALATALGQRGREYVTRNYSWEHVEQTYVDLIERGLAAVSAA